MINLDLKMSVDASSLSNNFTSLVRREREGNRKLRRKGGRREGQKEENMHGGKVVNIKNWRHTENIYLEENH